jgi:hypothetical protein
LNEVLIEIKLCRGVSISKAKRLPGSGLAFPYRCSGRPELGFIDTRLFKPEEDRIGSECNKA